MKEGMQISRGDDANTWSVSTVRVDTTEIKFYEDSISSLAEHLKSFDNFYLIDSQVAKHFERELSALLASPATMLIEGGDESKTWEQLRHILDRMYESNISRSGRVVSIGGGVVSDLGGLAANLYFRGIRAVHVPTTLLGMVDAAIGGKVGVNHPRQKNLLGSFYQPERCLICLDFLDSLPPDEFKSALGEVLKIAVVSSPELFEELEAISVCDSIELGKLRRIVEECVVQKSRILGENCYERSFSRILNFGHSIGHPIEDISRFRIKHGIAVGIGIAIASHISLQRKAISMSEFERIERVMNKLHLPSFDLGVPVDDLWHHVERLVLQRGGKNLLYIIPVEIGKAAVIDNITREQLKAAVTYFCSTSKHALISDFRQGISQPICVNG